MSEQNLDSKTDQEKSTVSSELKPLLAAPCLFCGYNGKEYYHAGTHKEKCPWYKIGGSHERELIIPKLVNLALVKIFGC